MVIDEQAKHSLHQIPIDEFYTLLKTTPKGITDFDAKQRLKKYGINAFSEPKKLPEWYKFLLQFKNMFSVLLLIGALLAFFGEAMAPGQGSIYVGYALFGVAVLNAAFTYLQEYKTQKAMDAFRNLLPQTILVIRNGVEKEIDVKELVPGDLIVLQEGSKVPADARVIEEHLLKVDHAALTGESEPQLRTTYPTHHHPLKSRNMVFSGTLVQSGTGKAIIVATGDRTEMGKIAQLTHNVKEETSKIRKELAHFVNVISFIAIGLGVLFSVIGMVLGISFWQSLIFGIGIIVANVPEGLLPTVTLTLALSAKRLAKNNALVKDMEAIETIGSVTVICTDKTGTLTKNQVSVTKLYLNNKIYHLEGETLKEQGTEIIVKPKQDKHFDKLLHIMSLCNNAHHIRSEAKQYKSSGDPTEVALLTFVDYYEDNSVIRHYCKRLNEIPFESHKKYMITLNLIDHKPVALLKGAPERVLEKCAYLETNGKVVKLTSQLRKTLLEHDENFANDGLRVLGFAYKPFSYKVAASQAPAAHLQKALRSSKKGKQAKALSASAHGYDHSYDKHQEQLLEKNDYIFVAMVALIDPPRDEVPEAVALCKQAGIKIIVISGDQPKTVKAIAKQVGIATNPVVYTSEDIAHVSDSKLKEMLKVPEVLFARAMPEDKLRIVHLLQQMGEVVAVTGDGVNDAPALKRADVGIAMGKSGTDVAKEASNLVLMDDNFATIVKAIKEGRTIYDNIKSFILYILTSNTPEIVPFLLFVLLDWPLALPVLLILAIDLGTDMLPAIGLGMEEPEHDVMKRPPRDPNKKLLTWKMVMRSYGFIGPLQTLFAYLMFFAVLFRGGWVFGAELSVFSPLYLSAVTAFFSTVVITQIFNVIACRTTRTSTFTKPLTNPYILVGIAVEILLLLALIFVPIISTTFGTAPFPFDLVPYMIGAGIFILLAEEARKFLYRKYGIFEAY
ncbi:MAG: HAD-IC family P-type ATPase [Candidatus Woesearchaeota archaeon]